MQMAGVILSRLQLSIVGLWLCELCVHLKPARMGQFHLVLPGPNLVCQWGSHLSRNLSEKSKYVKVIWNQSVQQQKSKVCSLRYATLPTSHGSHLWEPVDWSPAKPRSLFNSNPSVRKELPGSYNILHCSVSPPCHWWWSTQFSRHCTWISHQFLQSVPQHRLLQSLTAHSRCKTMGSERPTHRRNQWGVPSQIRCTCSSAESAIFICRQIVFYFQTFNLTDLTRIPAIFGSFWFVLLRVLHLVLQIPLFEGLAHASLRANSSHMP